MSDKVSVTITGMQGRKGRKCGMVGKMCIMIGDRIGFCAFFYQILSIS